MAVDDDNETAIRFLGQQYMQANYGAADDFPWLLEGWSSWIAGGIFRRDRSRVDSRSAAGDSGRLQRGGQRVGADCVAGAPADACQHLLLRGRPPVPELVAQAAMFWGWLVTNQPDAAATGSSTSSVPIPGSATPTSWGDMFDELGMDVGPVESMYLAWARAQ